MFSWIFSRNQKKTHGNFWIFSRNPKKHMDIFGFSAEIQKSTWTFLDFQQKSKKAHGHFRIFRRNPKKHMDIFGFSAESIKNMEIQNFRKKSQISKKSRNSKTVGHPQKFWKFWISMWFLDFQQKSKKTHGNFWIFSRNPKKHMDIFGFSAEIQKNTWKFLDFQQKSKKHMEIFGFSEEIQKNTWKFLDSQQKSKKNTWKSKISGKKSQISKK